MQNTGPRGQTETAPALSPGLVTAFVVPCKQTEAPTLAPLLKQTQCEINILSIIHKGLTVPLRSKVKCEECGFCVPLIKIYSNAFVSTCPASPAVPLPVQWGQSGSTQNGLRSSALTRKRRVTARDRDASTPDVLLLPTRSSGG